MLSKQIYSDPEKKESNELKKGKYLQKDSLKKKQAEEILNIYKKLMRWTYLNTQ